jgi:hypothetical protein
MKTKKCVIDTMILQKSNAPINPNDKIRESAQLKHRIELLKSISKGEFVVLFSQRMITEYNNQIPSPRNDFIKGFFALLSVPGRAVPNWDVNWTSDKQIAQKCRFPSEDYHVLRTAINPEGSTIFSEEGRMLKTDTCMHKHLKVHVHLPPGMKK